MGRIVVGNQVVTQRVPFTFSSGTLVLQQVQSGNLIESAWVLIDTPFDGLSASLALGTTASPGLLFSPGDTLPGVADQWVNEAITEFSLTDFLQLVVTAGGSTRGSGLLVYRFRS